MKLPFTASFELLGIDVEVMLSCTVEDDGCGNPCLSVDNVFDSHGKTSLLHNDDKLMADLGYRIADMAEDDTRLLARAAVMADFEREAA